jgi:hypothetical protein
MKSASNEVEISLKASTSAAIRSMQMFHDVCQAHIVSKTAAYVFRQHCTLAQAATSMVCTCRKRLARHSTCVLAEQLQVNHLASAFSPHTEHSFAAAACAYSALRASFSDSGAASAEAA